MHHEKCVSSVYLKVTGPRPLRGHGHDSFLSNLVSRAVLVHVYLRVCVCLRMCVYVVASLLPSCPSRPPPVAAHTVAALSAMLYPTLCPCGAPYTIYH